MLVSVLQKLEVVPYASHSKTNGFEDLSAKSSKIEQLNSWVDSNSRKQGKVAAGWYQKFQELPMEYFS